MMMGIKLDGLMIYLRKDEITLAKEIRVKLPAFRKMVKRRTVKLLTLSTLEKEYGKGLIKKFLFEIPKSKKIKKHKQS